MNTKPTFRDSVLRAIAVIGLVAILILGAWGIIQLVVGFPDFFSHLSGSSTTTTTPQAEKIVTVSPTSITSDQPFTLSWTHTGGSGNYGYTISYACMSGLSIAAPMPTGQMRIVPCNVPFNFTNATQSIQLIPVFHTATNGTTTFTIAATRLSDGKIATSGTSAVTTVVPTPLASTPAPVAQTQHTTTPTAAPVKTTKPKPAASYTASGRISNLYGYPDLAVRIISLTPSGSRYVAQFEITNVGTNVAPVGWDFYAQLPLDPPYTYTSQSQQKLYPGDKIVYTLGFDAPVNTFDQNPYMYGDYPYAYPSYNPYQSSYRGTRVFSVTADPQNLITELNKSNNTASATLSY